MSTWKHPKTAPPEAAVLCQMTDGKMFVGSVEGFLDDTYCCRFVFNGKSCIAAAVVAWQPLPKGRRWVRRK